MGVLDGDLDGNGVGRKEGATDGLFVIGDAVGLLVGQQENPQAATISSTSQAINPILLYALIVTTQAWVPTKSSKHDAREGGCEGAEEGAAVGVDIDGRTVGKVLGNCVGC